MNAMIADATGTNAKTIARTVKPLADRGIAVEVLAADDPRAIAMVTFAGCREIPAGVFDAAVKSLTRSKAGKAGAAGRRK